MPQLTVRNVPESVVRALRIRAAHSGRSAEAEHRALLAEALTAQTNDFWEQAAKLRRQTKKPQTDSGILQREMRDER